MMDETNKVGNSNERGTFRESRNLSNCNSGAIVKTEWDQRMMEEVLRSLNECNVIRYASYRTASKMQVLHRSLNMQSVQLELIAGVFERHRLSVTENSVTLDIHEVEDVLSDIYFAAQKEACVSFSVDLATKLAVSYIFRTFNKSYEDNILVFSVKVALTLVSSAKLEEKYGYLFHQLADHNACLSEAALLTLLSNICKVTEILGESVAYGNHLIRSSVENCFRESQGCLGVTEAEFARWLMEEPPLLTWISTLNRMKSAENIVHNIKCSSCKSTPVLGPRYSCLRCAGYHQCQTCFLFGKISGKHKLKHPVREYCIKTTNKEVTKLIIELIRNKLMLCPTRSVMSALEDSSPDADVSRRKAFDTISVRSTIKRRICKDPQKELQSIISRLEEENRQLQSELQEISGAKVERLQHHRVAIQSQLERLKVLKNHLFEQTPPHANLLQSTPMVHPISSRVTPLPLAFALSPIIHQGSVGHHDDEMFYNNKESSSRQTTGRISTDSAFNDLSERSRIELSTWIGGGKSDFTPRDSGFSQWLGPKDESSNKGYKLTEKAISDSSFMLSGNSNYFPAVNIPRDNTLYSLQRPDKHSQHSSLQNIQGDLSDILDRLQNMVANDCLLDETFSADNNCELKRAATEMEDLLTGLIEGMESRKTKLTTIV